MLLYLDLNCFNRPFDDQNQLRIAKETEAVITILQRIEDGTDKLDAIRDATIADVPESGQTWEECNANHLGVDNVNRSTKPDTAIGR